MQRTFQHKPGDNEKIPSNCSRENKSSTKEFYTQLDVRRKQTMFAQTKKRVYHIHAEKRPKGCIQEKKIKHRKERRSNKQ